MQTTQCKSCNKDFNAYPSEKRLYCGKSCANRETSKMRHATQSFGFVRGYHPKSEFKKNDFRVLGKNNTAWKGDEVGKTAIHDWIKRRLGLATECVSCNGELNAARYEWANISGEYKRDVNDWMMLCSICHRRHDDNTSKAWITRRATI